MLNSQQITYLAQKLRDTAPKPVNIQQKAGGVSMEVNGKTINISSQSVTKTSYTLRT